MAKRKNKRRSKLSPEEQKLKRKIRAHLNSIKAIFGNSGFIHMDTLSNSQFEFNGRTCDFDEVYVLENIIVLVEITTHNESRIKDHLLNKKIVFDYIMHDTLNFVRYLRSNFPEFVSNTNSMYQEHNFRVRIVYASFHEVKESIKQHVNCVHFLDYPIVKYFDGLVSAIKRSSKWEILAFLAVATNEFAASSIAIGEYSSKIECLILPETQSFLPSGYKVVSMYVSAADLIKRAYVLRRDTWRYGSDLYQRILLKPKLEGMRRHLLASGGVSINNIIVTLPSKTQILNSDSKQLEIGKINSVQIAKIDLPLEFNSVGIIDGQHRIYSYYEGGPDEGKMAPLRAHQNLLVTGIIFPPNTTTSQAERFSADLFLKINANQTSIKPELIQEIGSILKPFDVNSIARRVLNALNQHGPLMDIFASTFSEGDRLKTATVVSYGLVPLIRPGSSESLYHSCPLINKGDLLLGQHDDQVDDHIINEYCRYCASEINKFLGAARSVIHDRWTTEKSVPNRLLTTVNINGFLHCLRRLCANGLLMSVEQYRERMAGISSFDFSVFGSNRYNKLGQELAFEYFGVTRAS